MSLRHNHKNKACEILEQTDWERRLLAIKLHNGIGQHLVGLAFFGKSFLQQTERGEPLPIPELEEMVQIAEEGVDLFRALERDLHPLGIGEYGLWQALKNLAENVQFKHSNHGVFFDAEPIRVSPECLALQLYKIAEEAIGQAVENAKVKEISLSLKRQKNRLQMTIECDVRDCFGTPPFTQKEKPVLMFERARILKGRLIVEGCPDKPMKTRIFLSVPYTEPASESEI
jgi:signal transduction histidine kinase